MPTCHYVLYVYMTENMAKNHATKNIPCHFQMQIIKQIIDKKHRVGVAETKATPFLSIIPPRGCNWIWWSGVSIVTAIAVRMF